MVSIVKCPSCGKDVRWAPENRFRPFCSERCKQIDLGAWANEKYRIGGGNAPSDDDDPLGGDPSGGDPSGSDPSGSDLNH